MVRMLNASDGKTRWQGASGRSYATREEAERDNIADSDLLKPPHADFVAARHRWRIGWLSAVGAYADRDVQHQWTDPEQRNPYYSYRECACSYFDDCDIRGGYDFFLRLGYVSQREAAIILDFHHRASAYAALEEHPTDAAILADPRWQAVVDAARDARERLLPRLKNPDEIRALTQPLVWEPIDNGFRCELTGSSYFLPRPLVPNAFEQPVEDRPEAG